MIDSILKQITFKYVEGIKNSHVDEREDKITKKKINVILLEGVNFYEIFNYSDFINVNKIESNDIGTILRIYGVCFFIILII